MGHGIVGDKLYGVDESLFLSIVEDGRPMEDVERELGLSRHALHAASLEVWHPETGARVGFTAPWPDPLEAIISGRGISVSSASDAAARARRVR